VMYTSLLRIGFPGMSRSFLGGIQIWLHSRRLRHPLRLTPNSTIMNVAAFRTRTVSPGPWPRAPLVDRFLRKANIKLMRPPVRYVDNRVEILLQQLARIGFQVAPFTGFVKLAVVIAGRVEIEGSAAISFLVSGRSTARKS
jgi:hypothetical protein